MTRSIIKFDPSNLHMTVSKMAHILYLSLTLLLIIRTHTHENGFMAKISNRSIILPLSSRNEQNNKTDIAKVREPLTSTKQILEHNIYKIAKIRSEFDRHLHHPPKSRLFNMQPLQFQHIILKRFKERKNKPPNDPLMKIRIRKKN